MLEESVNEVLLLLEDTPCKDARPCYATNDTVISKKLIAPLKVMENQLGISVPIVGVRAAVNSPHLRERVLDDLYDYKEAIAEFGSTPHRRMAQEQLERFPVEEADPVKLPLSDAAEANKEDTIQLNPTLEKTVGAVLSPPSSSARDEKKLIALLTSFAEGCLLKNQPEEAYTTLSGSLKFAYGDDARSTTHANVATAAMLSGKFKEAEFHSRESALLGSSPKPSLSGKRGYALWATAVAYQDDYARAERIIDEALKLYSETPEEMEAAAKGGDTVSLQTVKDQIHHFAVANSGKDPSLRHTRASLHAQRVRGIEHGSGMTFDNEFDWTVFKNRLYPAKMNPGTNEMGSVFRRVGDMGGAISTSRSMEPL